MYLSENLKKFRAAKGMTQEEVANDLHITSQSVSKWERGETYPDITFLPALANLFDTSIDLLIGMDSIRAEESLREIHRKANDCLRAQEYAGAEKIYREALTVYPSKPEMLLGLASALALAGQTGESITLAEMGLSLSRDEKQNATMRAVLCFLYAKNGEMERAKQAASRLPHQRESREVIVPLIGAEKSDAAFEAALRTIILGNL